MLRGQQFMEKTFKGRNLQEIPQKKLNLIKIYRFIIFWMFLGCTNASGEQHAARVFETPVLHECIFCTHLFEWDKLKEGSINFIIFRLEEDWWYSPSAVAAREAGARKRRHAHHHHHHQRSQDEEEEHQQQQHIHGHQDGHRHHVGHVASESQNSNSVERETIKKSARFSNQDFHAVHLVTFY